MLLLPDADADRLMGATELGRQSMESFISSRVKSNETNFWDPIQKLKIKSFCSVAKTTVMSMSQKEKISSVNADRETFGRLLVAAKHRDIDLKEVLSYELCSVPIALLHPDGTLQKTGKSTLMPLLEKDVSCPSSLPCSEISTAYLIDAMALIQMLKSAGTVTFGELSKKYSDVVITSLSRNCCTRVDLAFDQYCPASIKAGERNKRGESSSLEVDPHLFRSSGQSLFPTQRTKKTWPRFFVMSQSQHLPERLSPSQKVFLAGGFMDGSRTVSLTQGSVAIEPNLCSDHEEADT